MEMTQTNFAFEKKKVEIIVMIEYCAFIQLNILKGVCYVEFR